MTKYIFILALLINVVVTAQPIKNFSTQKHTIQLSTGITMKYVEAGYDKGEVVILLHGYTDTGRSFFQTIDALTKLDPSLKIYALDQRGHGKSSMPNAQDCSSQPEACFAPLNFAQDVLAFMDYHRISKAFIVGHSMGSIPAQELALTHPERVQGLVLIGSFVNGMQNAFINDFLIAEIIDGLWKPAFEKLPGTWPQNAYYSKPVDLDLAVTQWIKTDWVADPTADPMLIQAIYPETMNIQLGTWIGAMRALSKVDNRIRLSNITVPTLVLWGIQDNAFTEKDQQEVRAALSEAARKNNTPYFFKVYGKESLPESGMQESDLGHNLQWGAPAQVAADIASFVKTGKPVNSLPYADPKNIKRVVVENTRER